jgi:hypothetical protein
MNQLSILVDGMLSGTGIRDAVNGGYLDPNGIGLSQNMQIMLAKWLSSYEDAHFHQYGDIAQNADLDRQGIDIAKAIGAELPSARVGYFSNAAMREISINN